MIISALCRHYDILKDDAEGNIPSKGYSRIKVSFAMTLSEDGELLGIVDLREKNNKGKVISMPYMIVPEQEGRSGSAVRPNFLWDNCGYVLGLSKRNDNSKKNRKYDCLKKFEAFKKKHHILLDGVDDPFAVAILKFLDKWDPKKALESHAVKSIYDELIAGGNIVFRLDGYTGYAHEREDIKNAWGNLHREEGRQVIAQCLVTGKLSKIQETHTKIKGVIGISSDSALVAINSPATNAYDSYGKSKAFNAPVSEEAVFKYTTALNYLLSSPLSHIQVGDATTVFWAESPVKTYVELAGFLLSPPASSDADGKRRDRSTERLIKDVLECVRDGRRISDITDEINEETKFYILGLSPNAGRIAIRYFYVNSFGNFVRNIYHHYRCMEIQEGHKFIPVWQMLNETIPKKSKDKKVLPLLGGQIMRSIITGAPYPYTIYSNILGRIRAEQDDRDKGIYSINSTRASIIKAYLSRNARVLKNKSYKEVLTVSLNEKSQNNAYLLGRLFALLEKAQENAADGKLNSTIKDRYFSTASASPGLVFPTLLRLSQHHIAKSDKNKWVEIRIGEVIGRLNSFPAHLNIEEQGVFILGYYHQREAFFKKNTEHAQN